MGLAMAIGAEWEGLASMAKTENPMQDKPTVYSRPNSVHAQVIHFRSKVLCHSTAEATGRFVKDHMAGCH